MAALGKVLEIIVIATILNVCYLFGYAHGTLNALQKDKHEKVEKPNR